MKLNYLIPLALVALLTACGGSDEEANPEDFQTRDNTAEVEAYYAANPDFFSFKTLADLPTDLTWKDGSHMPEMGSPDAKKGGTLYGRLQDFPRTLRTVGPDSNGSFRPYILDDTGMQFGHRHGDEFDYYGGLAQSWAVDMENRTVYVKLEPEATWSDGVPITSDDVMFMFFFYQSPYIIAPWYNNWYGTQYTNITRYDEQTFSISVPEAKPDMEARVLELRPMPQHFYRELGDDFVERYQWRFAPTAGAYIVKDEDLKKGRSVTLTRNKDWWAKDKRNWRYRFNPDRIHLSVIRDTAKYFEAFKRGDVDQFDLRLAEHWYEKLPDNDPDVENGYIHKTVFYNQYPRPPYGLYMNSARPLLDNRDIRVGIQHAANWQLVLDKFFRGDYTRMRTNRDGYKDFTHPDITAREFDIDKAEAAFARAGFTDRGPDGILVNEEGQRLSFNLSTGYENYKEILTILKEEAIKAGLELRVEILDGTSGWKKVQEKKHDIHFVAFSGFLEMYPRYWEFYHSDNAYDVPYLEDGSVNPDRKLKTQTNNLESISSPELDEMINAYRASDDKQEMIDLSFRMQEWLYDYASFSPGFVEPGYRLGHWRWNRYPEEFFNHKYSRSYAELYVNWIDTEMKEDTQAAMKEGRSFEKQVNYYEQFKNN